MTGFGRFVSEKLTVEIQSLNRKGLEIAISLPKELSHAELSIRKWVAEAVSRGAVSVRIFVSSTSLTPDLSLLKKGKQAWEKLAKSLDMDVGEITLSFLLEHSPPLAAVEEKPVEEGIKKALKELMQMKQREGEMLGKEIKLRLKNLEKGLQQIEKNGKNATTKMREKLSEKLLELQMDAMNERLLKEVALFAEKVDITEEICRFKSHIAQFSELLLSEHPGRKIDFLIQEMGREVNTIGSKSLDAAISHLVVEMKAELEKMREQVQNIE